MYYRDVLSSYFTSLLGFTESPLVLSWMGSVLGTLIGGGSLLVVALFYEKIRKRQGLGMGDVKMMALVGAFLGYRLTILTIFFGSLVGLLAGIYLILFRKMNLQTKLAFGVFLGGAAAFSLFFGYDLLHLYLNSLR